MRSYRGPLLLLVCFTILSEALPSQSAHAGMSEYAQNKRVYCIIDRIRDDPRVKIFDPSHSLAVNVSRFIELHDGRFPKKGFGQEEDQLYEAMMKGFREGTLTPKDFSLNDQRAVESVIAIRLNRPTQKVINTVTKTSKDELEKKPPLSVENLQSEFQQMMQEFKYNMELNQYDSTVDAIKWAEDADEFTQDQRSLAGDAKLPNKSVSIEIPKVNQIRAKRTAPPLPPTPVDPAPRHLLGTAGGNHERALQNIEVHLRSRTDSFWRKQANQLPAEDQRITFQLGQWYAKGLLDPAKFSPEIAGKIKNFRKYKVITMIQNFHSTQNLQVPDADSTIPLAKKIYEKTKDSIEKDSLSVEDFPAELKKLAAKWIENAKIY